MSSSDTVALADKTAWLFDMDGTLTHAVHDFQAIKESLALPPERPILESLALLPEDEAARKYQELDTLEMEIAALAVAQPDAAKLLAGLKARGARLGILTRNGKAIAHATLEACGLAGFFDDHSVVSRDCCPPKPDPAGVHLLLNRLQVSVASAVMVGDYRFDMEAGRAAGVTTVHFDVTGEFAFPGCTDIKVQSLQALLKLG